MAQAGLAGVSRRRFVITTVEDGGWQAPELVERNFGSSAMILLLTGRPMSGQRLPICRRNAERELATLRCSRQHIRREVYSAAPTLSLPVFEAEYVGGEIGNLASAQVQVGHPAVWRL